MDIKLIKKLKIYRIEDKGKLGRRKIVSLSWIGVVDLLVKVTCDKVCDSIILTKLYLCLDMRSEASESKIQRTRLLDEWLRQTVGLSYCARAVMDEEACCDV